MVHIAEGRNPSGEVPECIAETGRLAPFRYKAILWNKP